MALELRRFERDGKVDAAVLEALWGGARGVAVVEEEADAGAAVDGGLVSDMRPVVVRWGAGGEEWRCVWKKLPASKQTVSSALGLPREARFYVELADRVRALGVGVPACVAAWGDEDSGEKQLLLRRVEGAVQAGWLFGAGSPHNWGKDLRAAEERAAPSTALSVTRELFLAFARVHRAFRRNERLADLAWLRGAEWVRGEGRARWEAGVAHARKGWEARDQSGAVRWDARVQRVVDGVLGACDWDEFREWITSSAWTLVHADFHPANALVDVAAGGRVVMVDWEAVGLGSGPQDLAQWCISHATPSLRAEIERDTLPLYAEEAGETLDAVRAEYVQGGAGRWVWMLAVLAGMALPAPMLQYFHDQLLSFLTDHHIDDAPAAGLLLRV